MANIDSKNKTLDRKLKIEQYNQLKKKPGVDSGAPDGKHFQCISLKFDNLHIICFCPIILQILSKL